MRRLGVEVVARAVEIDREEHHAVHAVLLAVALRQHQHHLLGDAVGRVGFLGIAVPQVFLAERDRGELGIGADGSHRHQLPHPSQPALFEDVQSHHGVCEHVAPRVCAIGADAPNLRRKMENQIWLRIRHQLAHRLAVDQIVVVDEGHEDVPCSPPLQLFVEETA